MRKFFYLETQTGKKIRAVEFHDSAPRIWIILQGFFCVIIFKLLVYIYFTESYENTVKH